MIRFSGYAGPVIQYNGPTNVIRVGSVSDSGQFVQMREMQRGTIPLTTVGGCAVLIQLEIQNSNSWESAMYDGMLSLERKWWGGRRPIASKVQIDGRSVEVERLWRMLATTDNRLILKSLQFTRNE